MRNLKVALALGCCIVSGCGKNEKTNRLPVFKVGGTIVYKGKPVTGADVTFFCVEKDKSAFGRTDEQGHFKLTTYASNDGAVAGKHVVVVQKLEQPQNTFVEPPVDSPQYDPLRVEKAATAKPLKPSIPAKYSDAKKSDLIAMVNDQGGNEEMTLELKD